MNLIYASVVILFLSLTSVQAQVAKKIWSSLMICPQTTDGRISTFASNGSTLATFACGLGPIMSNDAGRTFRASMSPAEASSLQYAPSVGWLCDDVFLIAGIDNSFGSEGTAYRSDDGGMQWTRYSRSALQEMKFKSVSGFDSWIFQHNGTAKFFDLYTTNCGESWLSVPMPDSLYRPNNVSYFQLRDGTFAVKSRTPNKWYTVDYTSRIYKESWLPNTLERVFRLPDSSLFGIAASRSSHSFYRSFTNDTTMQPFVLHTTDGALLDSTFVGTTTQLLGGAVVVQLPSAPKELFIVDGQSEFTLHRDSISTNSLAWGSISSSDRSTFIVQLLLEGGKILRFLVDVSARRVIGLPSSFNTIRPDVLLSNAGTAIAFEDDGRILILDANSGDVLVGGAIDDQFNRGEAIPIERLVVIGGRRFALDRLGDVSEFLADTVCKLTGRGVERMVHIGIDERAKITRQFLFGHALVWAAGDGLVVGGAVATLLRTGSNDSVLFDDTTTFFNQSPTGRSYVGSKRPYMRMSNATSFTALGIIGDGRANLSALIEAGPNILIAGARGFVKDSAGSALDTIRGGVWFSTNQGGSWIKANLPDGCEFVYSLAYREEDSTMWASCTQGTLLADGIELNDLLLIRSLDRGRTWTEVERVAYHGPWIASDCNITISDQGVMAWTARDRLLLSRNKGSLWVPVEGLPQSPHVISSATFASDGAVHVATSQGYYRLEQTTSTFSDEQQQHHKVQFDVWINPLPTSSSATLHLSQAAHIAGRAYTLQILDNCGKLITSIEGTLPAISSTGDINAPIVIPSMSTGLYHVLGQIEGQMFSTKLMIVH